MIVILLRHADKIAPDGLSPAGKERAKLLARMLGDAGVSVAFRTQFERAKETLGPLKEKVPGVRIEEITTPTTESGDHYAQRVAAAVRALPADAVVAVVGHSDTVGPTIAHLGGGSIDPIGEHEFDKLFVLFVEADRPPSLLKLRYGEPT
jgi:broad specificity phosphatase PhoE